MDDGWAMGNVERIAAANTYVSLCGVIGVLFGWRREEGAATVSHHNITSSSSETCIICLSTTYFNLGPF